MTDGLSRRLEQADGVGLWTPAVTVGDRVRPGQVIGKVERLGVVHVVRASEGASGRVAAIAGGGRVRVPVDHGAMLLELERGAAETEAAAEAGVAAKAAAAGALAIRAPSSGRFYGRPGPGKPAFVAVGDPIGPGQTVGLLEVMKSFHRVTAGDDVPAGARVTAIVADDDADVDAGAVLVRLEAPP
ncbi:MAG TPA: biotin/lipoyl-containing protein [Kofleriaceae bacterium]|nr:biotin/lipoyl-containing protein [Kofleriaceae bacterium]